MRGDRPAPNIPLWPSGIGEAIIRPVSYQVFARKYRPQTFEEVVGQEHVTRTLRNAIEQNRLAHAYLFVGPRGIGKTSTARILAKALNCEKGPTITPCGVCDNCREITQGNSLDVVEIDGASNNSVEDVRNLRDNVKFAPARGTFRIYIIDEVHMLSSQAFNALLKTLEEPPEHVKFIFATTEPQKVLATILSRCQRFDLRRIPARLIADHLLTIAGKESIDLAEPAAAAIAKAAEGGLRDAESMLDQLVAFCGDTIQEQDVLDVFGLTGMETTGRLAAALVEARTDEALRIIEAQQEEGKDLTRLLSDLIGFFRNLLLFQITPETVDDTDRAILEPLSGTMERGKILDLIDLLADAESRMRWVPNKQVHFEIAVVRAVQSLEQASLDEILDTLNEIRGGAPARSVKNSGERRRPIPANTPTVPKSGKATESPRKEPADSPAETPQPEISLRQAVAAAAGDSPEEKVEPTEKPSPRETNGKETPVSAVEPGDLQGTWKELVSRLRRERPLYIGWMENGVPLELGAKELLVGFSPAHSTSAESMKRPESRQFLNGLLEQITGKPLQVKIVVQDGLQAPEPLPELEPEEAGAGTEEFDEKSFLDDPLIKKALEIFEGKLETSNKEKA